MKVFFVGILGVFMAGALWAADPSIMQQAYVVRQAFPGVKTIGVLCHTSHAAGLVNQLKVAGTAYLFDLRVVHTETLQSVREGFDQMLKQGQIDLLWVLPDDVADQKFGRRFLSEKCMALKIPLYVSALDRVREGGLLTVASADDGTLKIFLNKRLSEMLGLQLPAEIQSRVVVVE